LDSRFVFWSGVDLKWLPSLQRGCLFSDWLSAPICSFYSSLYETFYALTSYANNLKNQFTRTRQIFVFAHLVFYLHTLYTLSVPFLGPYVRNKNKRFYLCCIVGIMLHGFRLDNVQPKHSYSRNDGLVRALKILRILKLWRMIRIFDFIL
jgi:hypothetical protein